MTIRKVAWVSAWLQARGRSPSHTITFRPPAFLCRRLPEDAGSRSGTASRLIQWARGDWRIASPVLTGKIAKLFPHPFCNFLVVRQLLRVMYQLLRVDPHCTSICVIVREGRRYPFIFSVYVHARSSCQRHHPTLRLPPAL